MIFYLDDLQEPEQEDDWRVRVSSGFDRLFKLSTELDKSRRSIEEDSHSANRGSPLDFHERHDNKRGGDFDDYKQMIKTEDRRSNRGNK